MTQARPAAATATSSDVLRWRMASLLLDVRSPRTPGDIVRWFGAMQAQDLGSGQWSFGVRSAGLTQSDVELAVAQRSILRTWPMRGTVHFVPAEDARWMLQLTGVRALAGAAARRAYLGLDETTVNAAADLLAVRLAGGGGLRRSECVDLLVQAGLHTAKEHGYHLLWYASQIGVTCMGPQIDGEQTFVLLDEWVPNGRRLERDEALAELALRYFRSHGPTTPHDFAGWTGLPVGDARNGIAAAGDQLQTVAVEGVLHVMAAGADTAAPPARRSGTSVLLLPGFDEFILGFKDRSLMLPEQFKQRIIPGGNGVFMWTIVGDGRVIGTWRRSIKKDRVEIRTTPFCALNKQQQAGIRHSGEEYGRFLQLPVRHLE